MPDTPIPLPRSDAVLSPDTVARLGGLLAGLDQLDPILSLPQHPDSGEHYFGRYRLRSRLGSGRFGVVLLAEDPVLGRKVVVKVPQPAVLADAELRQRFEREVRAAARLEHPGIVPILEAGEIGGLPFLVAAYVAGPTLAAWLADHPGPLEPNTAARLAADIAAALDHAHERAVLHCDLSPSNILLAPDPTRAESTFPFTPSVTDFGMARLLEDDPSTTQTYRVAGTPAYMAPEQALGQRRALTSRSDVYALGAMLYETLTGSVPIRAKSSEEVLERLATTRPVSPRRLNPRVPRDLAAICLKCLEREPRDRYSSTAALAEDLERFLSGQPVSARPIRLLVRCARWARQHPLSASLLAAAFALTTIAIITAARLWADGVNLRAALIVAEHDQNAAVAQTHAALVRSTLDRVRQRRVNRTAGWTAANRLDLQDLAGGGIEPFALTEMRSEVAAVATAFELGEPTSVAMDFRSQAIAFDAGTKRLAACELMCDLIGAISVRILELPTTRDIRRLQYPSDRVWELRASRKDGSWSAAFSPDGRWLVVGTRSGWVVVWDLDRSESTPLKRWRHGPPAEGGSEAARNETVFRLAFDSDGRLWSGNHKDCAAWDPARDWSEVARRAGLLYRPTGTLARNVSPARSEVNAAGPNAEWFVQRSEENGLNVVLADNHRVGRISLVDDVRAEDDTITDFAVSPDGLLVGAAAEFAGHVKLWSVASGRLLAARHLNERSLRLAFSPDGRTLAVICSERILLYPIVRPAALQLVGLQANPLDDFDLSADSERFATHSTVPGRGGQVRLRVCDRMGTTLLERDLPPSRGNSRPRVAIHPVHQEVAVHTGERVVRLPFHTKSKVFNLHRPNGTRELRFTLGGRLWSADTDSAYTWRDGDLQTIRTGGDVTSLATDDAGAVIGLRDGSLVWCSPEGERTRVENITDSEITGLSRTGDHVIAGTDSGDLWIVRAGRSPVAIRGAHSDAILGIAIGPQGWFASGSGDGELRIWDEAGKLVLALAQSRPVRRILWSTNGSTLTFLAPGERALRQIRIPDLKSAIAAFGIDPRLP